jgi:hypothetical protein
VRLLLSEDSFQTVMAADSLPDSASHSSAIADNGRVPIVHPFQVFQLAGCGTDTGNKVECGTIANTPRNQFANFQTLAYGVAQLFGFRHYGLHFVKPVIHAYGVHVTIMRLAHACANVLYLLEYLILFHISCGSCYRTGLVQ